MNSEGLCKSIHVIVNLESLKKSRHLAGWPIIIMICALFLPPTLIAAQTEALLLLSAGSNMNTATARFLIRGVKPTDSRVKLPLNGIGFCPSVRRGSIVTFSVGTRYGDSPLIHRFPRFRFALPPKFQDAPVSDNDFQVESHAFSGLE